MRIFLSAILFLITISTYGQKEANFWYFGHNAGLDFSSGSPVALVDGQLDTFEGCSTIADKEGNLLFYSDGITVWDKTHTIMNYTNGLPADDLLGNPSSTQSAVVVPHPTITDIYYLFTVDNGPRFSGGTKIEDGYGLNLYTIDLTKNAGLGEVLSGSIDLSNGNGDNWSEKITSVQGKDCDTFWIISSTYDEFYAYKIDTNGVQVTSPIISPISSPIFSRRGYLKVSPDGTKIVSANQQENTYIFDFDTQSGIITNQRAINISSNLGYGVEFSQNSKKLYISTGTHSQNNNDPENTTLYQFDIESSDINIINNSRVNIHSFTGFRGALQLGADGKIYYAKSRENTLGVINFPENDGLDVNYIHDGVSLGLATSSEGLPPFIQSFFSPINIVDIDTKTINLNEEKQFVCNGQVLDMEPEIVGVSGSTYKWTKKGDPSVNITTRSISIDYVNYGTGVYNLEMIIIDACGRINKYNSSVEVEFLPLPEVFSIPLYEQCDFDSNPADGITSFNLQSKEGLLTNNALDVTVEFFETSDVNFTNPILNKGNYRNLISTNLNSHKLTVRITNNTSGCQEFGEIELKTNATSLASYPDLYLTESDVNANIPNSTNSLGSGNVFFDFDLKTTDIIANSGGAFSLATHTFEYYRTATDATLQTNQIVAPYDDDYFVNNSTIFVRLSTIGTNACSGIGQFKIFVNTRPIPLGNTNAQYLCVNNPIDNPQQITIDLNADTGIPTDTYQWFLNSNLITGATNAIHKANVQGTYKVIAYREYQNDVNDPNDNTSSTGYNTFTIIESNKALIVSTTLTDNVDNPEKNILKITISGIGDYEYALNSTNPSSFSKGTGNLTFTFDEVKPGLNTVYIRDLNGCGTTSSQKLSFLFFQRHFTPNNDGVYDTWKILGSNNSFYKSARVEIFDRYGKVVALITDKDSDGWNGTYNGKKLPSNDYWFNAVLEDMNGNIRKETGHFSLLRK